MDRETAERWKAMLRAMESEEAKEGAAAAAAVEVEEVDLSALNKKERRRLERFHLEIGDVLELDKGRRGILHFVGRVEEISSGKELLFGVELLDKATGKHNVTAHGAVVDWLFGGNVIVSTLDSVCSLFLY